MSELLIVYFPSHDTRRIHLCCRIYLEMNQNEVEDEDKEEDEDKYMNEDLVDNEGDDDAC